MNPDGPYLSVAAICDAVLQEKATDRVSCIRFVDRVIAKTNRPVMEGEEFHPYHLSLSAFCLPKSGKFRGSQTVRFALVKDNGEQITGSVSQFPAAFKGGDEGGVNLVLELTFHTKESGLYWFDVYLEDELVTRIPLRVSQSPPVHPESPHGQPTSETTNP